jgi:ABC-2 type transport system ATP-binding protein
MFRGMESSASGAPSVASLESVTRRFGELTAVDDLSLHIQRGETVALLGPNGAGKTTTVEMLLGLVEPNQGAVRLFGTQPAEAIARGWVGAMLQDAGLPQWATVAELVELIRGMYPDPFPLKEALRVSDLADVASRQAQRLSGGQRQRLRVAMALAGNPDLLVLDEPTASLDVEARRGFWQRARAWASRGQVLLFATHRLEEAEAVADRVVVISRGRLVADGTPDEIKSRSVARAPVGAAGDDLPGMEEAFLALTREEGSR